MRGIDSTSKLATFLAEYAQQSPATAPSVEVAAQQRPGLDLYEQGVVVDAWHELKKKYGNRQAVAKALSDNRDAIDRVLTKRGRSLVANMGSSLKNLHEAAMQLGVA